MSGIPACQHVHLLQEGWSSMESWGRKYVHIPVIQVIMLVVYRKQRCGTVTIFYGSGSGSSSDFWKVMVQIPIPTFKKFWFRFRFCFRFQLHIFAFLPSNLFYKGKVYKFQPTYCKMWMKKMLNEVNQIHNFISSSGSGNVIKYGSSSEFLTSYGSGSVPLVKKLWFLQFRFRFHNADRKDGPSTVVQAEGSKVFTVQWYL